MSLTGSGRRFHPLLVRRSYHPNGTTRQRRNRAAVQAVNADKRRLRFLWALITSKALLPSRDYVFIQTVLGKAQARECHYIMTPEEREACDYLQAGHASKILPQENTENTKL